MQLLQVFESHGDVLNDELFLKYSFKYLTEISEKVRQRLKEENIPDVPMVSFKINIIYNVVYILFFKFL